jgi:hypothetical protein
MSREPTTRLAAANRKAWLFIRASERRVELDFA